MRSSRQDRRSAPYQDRKDNTAGSSSRDLSSHSADSSQLGSYSTLPANISAHGGVRLTTPTTRLPQTPNERSFGVRFLPPTARPGTLELGTILTPMGTRSLCSDGLSASITRQDRVREVRSGETVRYERPSRECSGEQRRLGFELTEYSRTFRVHRHC